MNIMYLDSNFFAKIFHRFFSYASLVISQWYLQQANALISNAQMHTSQSLGMNMPAENGNFGELHS